jgi:uroporphyrinogen decarboxylase
MRADERFLAACARRPVDRTPVWMMRQAGRYLPEYRAIRERVDFLTLCKTPDLAAEVSLQPIQRFGMDACVVFSDILLPLEPLGFEIAYDEAGPRIPKPIRVIADLDRLHPFDVASLAFVGETLSHTRKALDGRAALIGFVGGAYTLASYLIEGGSSRQFAHTKRFFYEDPAAMESLCGVITDALCAFARAQVRAGAQAVQVFDTWAGELSPWAFERFALPAHRALASAIHEAGVPAILYVNGCAGKFASLRASGADAISVDWRVSLADAREALGSDAAVQGNVDPCALLAGPDVAAAAAQRAMMAAGPVGHVLNLGHGVLPETPIESARAFIDAAKAPVAI